MAGAGCRNHLSHFTGRHSGVTSTALTLAVQTGDLELVRFFVERGAPVNLATLTKGRGVAKDQARAATLLDQGCRGKVQWACARLTALAAARR